MTERARTVLAWAVMALCAALIVGGLIVVAVYDPRPFEWSGTGFGLAMLMAPAIGALIVSRSPNMVGWLLLVVGLGGTLAVALGSVADARAEIPGQLWAAWLGNWIWVLALGSLILTLQLFPDGRPVSPRWRWLIALTGAAVASLVLGGALAPGPLGDFRRFTNPIGIDALEGTPVSQDVNVGWLLLIPSILGSAASLVVRYRRSRGERRQQLKWLAYAAVLFGAGWIAVTTTWESPALGLVGEILFGLGLLSLPVGIGIAVLRYRLYDIDVVINKTLVYALLAAFITTVYVGVVVGLGSVIGNRGEPNIGLSIAATALVAVAFQPVRERVQRLANGLVYGKRASPYQVLSTFSGQLAGVYDVEDVLPRMARVVAEAAGAREAVVWLRVGGELRPAAAWPSSDGASPVPLSDGEVPGLPGADRAYPVHHQGELLGALAVAKAAGDALRPQEEGLLRDLASQAGLVLRNVRLTAELSARLEELSRQAEELRGSRRRIVATQDAERRRLERNLHDGAQQHLVALAVRLRLARSLADRQPEKARALLEELRADVGGTAEAVRDLARGLYPAALTEGGLVAALEAQASRSAVPVTVEAGNVRRYPPDVEAAAYFAAMEALQNSAKYADAARITVRLAEQDGALTFTVIDDGRGFDPETTPTGTGLEGMADRLAAVGGELSVRSSPGLGTTVAGRIPLEER